MSNDALHTWKITSKQPLLRLNHAEIWEYRDLLVLIIRRDFVSFYKQTILGPIWFFIQPVFTTIIFTFVFSKLAGISTEGVPGPLFYMAGITCWNYFSDCTLKVSSVFRDNADIFSKVYFPRLILPLSIIMTGFLRFGIQFIMFLLIWCYFNYTTNTLDVNLYAFLLPLLILQMAALGLGFGLVISSFTSKYRDLIFLLTFGIQLMMYATPVIVPLSAAPEKYHLLIQLNPMTSVIETFRFGFLGKGHTSITSTLYSWGFSLVTLFLGLISFNKIERNFIDTV